MQDKNSVSFLNFIDQSQLKSKGFPSLKKGGQGDLGDCPPEKSPSIPLFQRVKYHFHIWGDRI